MAKTYVREDRSIKKVQRCADLIELIDSYAEKEQFEEINKLLFKIRWRAEAIEEMLMLIRYCSSMIDLIDPGAWLHAYKVISENVKENYAKIEAKRILVGLDKVQHVALEHLKYNEKKIMTNTKYQVMGAEDV